MTDTESFIKQHFLSGQPDVLTLDSSPPCASLSKLHNKLSLLAAQDFFCVRQHLDVTAERTVQGSVGRRDVSTVSLMQGQQKTWKFMTTRRDITHNDGCHHYRPQVWMRAFHSEIRRKKSPWKDQCNDRGGWILVKDKGDCTFVVLVSVLGVSTSAARRPARRKRNKTWSVSNTCVRLTQDYSWGFPPSPTFSPTHLLYTTVHQTGPASLGSRTRAPCLYF